MDIKSYTIKLILTGIILCLNLSAFTQTYEWENASFAKTVNNYIPRSKIAITNDNHKLFAGQFEQSMDYKGITLTSALGYGSFVAMLDENDSLLWIRKFSENNLGVGGVNFIEVFDANYFYINIHIKDSVFVENQLYIANQTVPSYHKNLILKFDMNGNVIDDFYLDGTCFNFITDIYLDIEKNTYISGDYGNDTWSTTSNCTCIFDNQTFTTTKANLFLAKYDSLGNLIWINTFGDNKYIGSNRISVIDDAIYMSGSNMYASDIDFGSFTLTYPSNYDNGAFMAKFDTSGNFKWAKYYGVKGWDSNVGPKDLIALSANKIIVCGSVRTQSESTHLYFQNSSALTRNSSGSEFNYFIICYDSLGNIVWKDLALCNGDDYLTSMTTNEDNILFATGQYNEKMLFGNDTLPFSYDRLFVAAFDSIGTKLWAKDIGGGGGNSGVDIEIDGDDNLYINGWTTANPTIVGDSSYTINGPSVFIAKMVPSIISSTTNIQAVNPNKELLKIVGILGKESKSQSNVLLFYIYSDGTVEKRIVIE